MKNLSVLPAKKNILFLLLIILGSANPLFSQVRLSSDALFADARKAAFEKKNYPKAIQLSKTALIISPDYTDIHVFLGRLYNWSNYTDSARSQFNVVLTKNPIHEDALQASFDLEYRIGQYHEALTISDKGIQNYPSSDFFVIAKVKVLKNLDRSREAYQLAEAFMINHPNNKVFADLLANLKDELMVHKLAMAYNLVYFDKRFADNWHLASVSYGKQNKWGSANLSLNYANRFNKNASELELEAYPGISKGLYAYVGGGASLSSFGLFPKYRVGFSLYKSLPYSFEAEAGLRYLRFNEGTTLYVLGIGKYIHKSFVNLKSYLNPGDGRWSKSFNLSWRIYLSDNRYDYLGLSAGTGVSPDDRSQITNVVNQLKTIKAGIDYSKNLNKRTTIGVSASWINEEYFTNKFGNQLGASFSFQKRFR